MGLGLGLVGFGFGLGFGICFVLVTNKCLSNCTGYHRYGNEAMHGGASYGPWCEHITVETKQG